MEKVHRLGCFFIYALVAITQFTVVVASNAAFAGPFSGLFMKFPNHSLAVKSLSTKRVPNEMHCSMNCQRRDNCFSFNFAATNDSVGNFLCELLPTKHSYKHINFKTNDSFHHFSRKIPEDFCGVNAKTFPSPNSDSTYDCPCKDGYTGSRCEIDIDECESSPCVNGKCKDKVNAYKCNCVAGYTGVNCETDINECESNPCNKGTCEQDKVNSYKCNCSSSGFTGTNCEIEIDECSSNPCQNGGQCIDKINEYECNCTGTGYTGKYCETEINECSSNPCKNGGSCIDKINDYECNCAGTGYKGKTCETEIQPCDSNPCLNGGTCSNTPNTAPKFTCSCVEGYYGGVCRHQIYSSTSDYKTFAEAENECSNRGLQLAKITSEGVNKILQHKFQSDFWFGLKKKDGGWKWRDDTPLDEGVYSNWDSSIGNGWCIMMLSNTGKWRRDNCGNSRPFACLKSV